MSVERYGVTTIEGWLEPRVGGTRRAHGVSAQVHDRLYGSHVVAIYRSEDYTTHPAWAARYQAVADAQRRAEALNVSQDEGMYAEGSF